MQSEFLQELNLPQAENSVISRPKRLPYSVIGVLCLLICALYMAVPFLVQPRVSLIALILIESFFGSLFLVCVGYIVRAFRAFIRADEKGLTWRTGHADWSEVTDFYLSDTSTVIVLASGKKLSLNRTWTQVEEMKKHVALLATHARTHAWHPKEARIAENGPVTLRYDLRHHLGSMIVTLTGGIVLVVWPLTQIGNIQAMAPDTGLTFAVLYYNLPPLLLSIPIVAGILLGVRFYREVKRRKAHQIIVSSDGLVFSDGKHRIAAVWSDITDFYITQLRGEPSVRYIIETRSGSFDFLPHLPHARAVRLLIETAVPGNRKWQFREAGEPRPDEIDLTVPYVFHYRNTLGGFVPLLLTAVAVLFPFLLLLRALFGLPVDHGDSAGIGLSLAFAVAAAIGWWQYFAARIQVDSVGIHQRTIGRVRTLRWEEIETVEKVKDDWAPGKVCVKGATTTVGFDARITSEKLLLAVIEQRTGKSL